jgi:hypothetical protein
MQASSSFPHCTVDQFRSATEDGLASLGEVRTEGFDGTFPTDDLEDESWLANCTGASDSQGLVDSFGDDDITRLIMSHPPLGPSSYPDSWHFPSDGCDGNGVDAGEGTSVAEELDLTLIWPPSTPDEDEEVDEDVEKEDGEEGKWLRSAAGGGRGSGRAKFFPDDDDLPAPPAGFDDVGGDGGDVRLETVAETAEVAELLQAGEMTSRSEVNGNGWSDCWRFVGNEVTGDQLSDFVDANVTSGSVDTYVAVGGSNPFRVNGGGDDVIIISSVISHDVTSSTAADHHLQKPVTSSESAVHA